MSARLAFDGQLLVVQTEVILQLAVLGDDDRLTRLVVLRSTRTTHHLCINRQKPGQKSGHKRFCKEKKNTGTTRARGEGAGRKERKRGVPGGV